MTKGEIAVVVAAMVRRLDAAAAQGDELTHVGLADASSLVEDLLQDPEFLREIGVFDGNG